MSSIDIPEEKIENKKLSAEAVKGIKEARKSDEWHDLEDVVE